MFLRRRGKNYGYFFITRDGIKEIGGNRKIHKSDGRVKPLTTAT